MKKYVKPELFFESFEMTQQIAACQFGLNEDTYSDKNCSFTGVNPADDFEITIFLSSSNACENSSAESYCYFGSTAESFNIFNS